MRNSSGMIAEPVGRVSPVTHRRSAVPHVTTQTWRHRETGNEGQPGETGNSLRTMFMAGRLVTLKAKPAPERPACAAFLWEVAGKYFGEPKPACTCGAQS